MKRKLLIILACILAVIGVICKVYWPDSNINNTISDVENSITEEIKNIDEGNNVIITNFVEGESSDTKEVTQNGEDVATTEIIESSLEEEQNIIDEGAQENDAVIEQESISYNGDNTGNGLSLLGTYQGLTYYSQADSRWANVMYSSIGDSSQTMKSSACGPTSAAMVVSSSKGAILPTTMANLSVSNGYRTANNGTAWSLFPFVADYFGFNEYYTTSNFETAMSYLKTDKDNDGNSDYYIIVSCNSGLFTSGGHYIVLVANNSGTITVYDPYLYSGKFNTASRKNAGVVVSGNSAYVSESSFKNYANYRYFWIYSNDKGSGNLSNNSTSSGTTEVNYTRYVATQSSNLNVRNSAGGSVISSLKKGTSVSVVEVDGVWSRISSPVNGWVSTAYLSASNVTINSSAYNVKITAKSGLNIRSKAGSNYSKVGLYTYGTTVSILETNGNWGRTNKGWICLSYTTKITTSVSNTTSSNNYSLGLYVVNANVLNVRSGPGTNYAVKKTYKKGTRFDTYEIKNNWARTPSGWVCLNYCKIVRKY